MNLGALADTVTNNIVEERIKCNLTYIYINMYDVYIFSS